MNSWKFFIGDSMNSHLNRMEGEYTIWRVDGTGSAAQCYPGSATVQFYPSIILFSCQPAPTNLLYNYPSFYIMQILCHYITTWLA